MKKKLLIALFCAVVAIFATGCGTKEINVNFEEEQNIQCDTPGRSELVNIGNGLYYDHLTGIVYWWSGYLTSFSYCSTTPSPYYAPNGFPYRYNPGTNTFEEISNQ